MLQWTIDATIVSTGAKTTVVVEADRGEVTLSGPGQKVALDARNSEKLRMALGRAEGMRGSQA